MPSRILWWARRSTMAWQSSVAMIQALRSSRSELALAVRRLYPDKFKVDDMARLLGDDDTLAAIRKGETLAQIKADHPARDYEPRYGRTTGPWTTDMFVEAVYRSLGGK